MMKKTILFELLSITAMAGFISACGANFGLGKPPSMASTSGAGVTENSNLITSLPAQKLEKGNCSLFLWGSERARPLIFTQNINTDNATVLIDNLKVQIVRDQASDIVIPGFYAKQSFSSNGIKVDLKLKPEESHNLYEGIKIPSGILSVKKPDGSEGIIPVSGLLGCNFDK